MGKGERRLKQLLAKKEELQGAGNRGYHCMSGLFLFFSLLSVHWAY